MIQRNSKWCWVLFVRVTLTSNQRRTRSSHSNSSRSHTFTGIVNLLVGFTTVLPARRVTNPFARAERPRVHAYSSRSVSEFFPDPGRRRRPRCTPISSCPVEPDWTPRIGRSPPPTTTPARVRSFGPRAATSHSSSAAPEPPPAHPRNVDRPRSTRPSAPVPLARARHPQPRCGRLAPRAVGRARRVSRARAPTERFVRTTRTTRHRRAPDTARCRCLARSRDRQLGGVCQRESDHPSTAPGARCEDHLGAKRTPFRLPDAPTTHVDPLLVARHVSHVGNKDPRLTTLLGSVDDDRVAVTQAVPISRSYEVAISRHLGAFLHTHFLPDARAEAAYCHSTHLRCHP